MNVTYNTHEGVEKCMYHLGKPEGRKSLGGPRRGQENNIKIDFEVIECEDVY
jgi:hypothetical protein